MKLPHQSVSAKLNGVHWLLLGVHTTAGVQDIMLACTAPEASCLAGHATQQNGSKAAAISRSVLWQKAHCCLQCPLKHCQYQPGAPHPMAVTSPLKALDT